MLLFCQWLEWTKYEAWTEVSLDVQELWFYNNVHNHIPTLIERIFLNHHYNESNADPSKSIESDEPVRARTKAPHLKTPNTLFILYHVPTNNKDVSADSHWLVLCK